MIDVSVIVPVYNVSGFVERCVRSLMEQTLDNVEFIFVVSLRNIPIAM